MHNSQHSEFLVRQKSQWDIGLPNRSSDSASEDHFVWSTAVKLLEQTSSTKRMFCIKKLCSVLFPQMWEIRSCKQSVCVWTGLESYCYTTACIKWIMVYGYMYVWEWSLLSSCTVWRALGGFDSTHGCMCGRDIHEVIMLLGLLSPLSHCLKLWFVMLWYDPK